MSEARYLPGFIASPDETLLIYLGGYPFTAFTFIVLDGTEG